MTIGRKDELAGSGHRTIGVTLRLVLVTAAVAALVLGSGMGTAWADDGARGGGLQLAWSVGGDKNAILAELPDSRGFLVEETPAGQVLVVKGYSTGGPPGYPQLPMMSLRFLVPPDIDWSTLSVGLAQGKRLEVPGKYDLAAAPPAATDDDGQLVVDWGEAGAEEIRDGRNIAAYRSAAYYPESPLVVRSTGAYRQWNIVTVEYWPFSYSPAQKQLRRLEDAKIELRFARLATGVGPAGAVPGQSKFWDRIEGELVNAGAQSEYYPAVEDPAAPQVGDSNDYVIITTAAIQQNSTQLGNFVGARTAMGHAVKVVTEGGSEDDTHYLSGGDADARADNIRNWLVNHYLSEGVEYLLLIGNPDPTEFDSSVSVPMKMCWPWYSEGVYMESPTDFYYGDLTGDWDADGDGVYGEQSDATHPDGIDRISEVVVGRIPFYGSYTDLDSILSKTIAHMQGGEQSWREKLLVAAAVSNFSPEDHNQDGDVADDGEWSGTYRRTFGADWGNALDSVATGNGISSYTLYERSGAYSNGSAYPLDSCDAGLTKSNLISEWQQHYGFVAWWGHGGSTGAYRLLWNHDGASPNPGDQITQRPGETGFSSFMLSSDCSQLDDAYPSYVVQVSCLNGYPESSSNLGYALLEDGAVGTVSSSRVSWYAVGSWSTGLGELCGDNASYAYDIFQDMAGDGDTVGTALANCRRDYGLYWSSGSSWMNCCDFNLYGDPALTLVAVEPPNQDPYAASAPGPADDSTDQPIDAYLSWSGGDPDYGDTVTYDVYLEADDSQPGTLIETSLPVTYCAPGGLAKSTHYYWQVIATDNHEASTEGPVWDFYTEGNFAPSVQGVGPISGCCYSGVRQAFTTTCSDPNGWQDVKWVSFAIGQDQSGDDGLYAYYNQNSNLVYLRNEEGTDWIGGFAPGSGQTIENSRVTLHLEDTSTVGAGDLLTVEWSVTFKSTVPGEKHSYVRVTDDDDAGTAWEELGDWNVANPVPVVVGWNLISFPVSPVSTAVADALATIDGKYDLVHAYDTETDTWLTYQVGGPPGQNTLTDLDETMGFWLRATEPGELMPPGCVPASADVGMYAGWNLVGYACSTARPVTETLASIAGLYDMVWAFDPLDPADPWKRYDPNVAPVFNDLADMGPGGGHWVRVTEDCSWAGGAGEGQALPAKKKLHAGFSAIREAILDTPPPRPD